MFVGVVQGFGHGAVIMSVVMIMPMRVLMHGSVGVNMRMSVRVIVIALDARLARAAAANGAHALLLDRFAGESHRRIHNSPQYGT
ncbi:MAG: hypothetical protein ACM3SV_01585 [Betaproteobacteria bacterium]